MVQPNSRKSYVQELTLESIENDLRVNPRYQSFFSAYDENSVQTFIKHYATTKLFTLQNKDNYRESYEAFHTECMSWADDMIKMILQKKLFNMQCLWRAEKLVLSPFVEISRDFDYWSKNILTCPFIEPISKDELKACVQFLQKEDFVMVDWFDKWQDYDSFKHQNKEHNWLHPSNYYHKMPSFYTFYDKKLKTEYMLTLPDIRGEKEKKYEDAYFEQCRKEYDAQNAFSDNTTISSNKPYLSFVSDDYLKFVEEVEDRETKWAFYYKKALPHHDDNYELNKNLELLRRINEPVKMLADDDWMEAIAKTVRQFKRQKAIEFLHFSYDTYMMQFDEDAMEDTIYRRMKSFTYDIQGHDYHFFMHWRNRILKGRKYLGEKENFDF